MKKIRYYIFCSLLLSSLHSMYGANTHSDDPMFNAMPVPSQEHLLKKLTPEEVITLLNELAVPNLLEHNIYCRTNRINSRSLLDYSVFLDPKMKYEHRWVTNIHAFYNQTSR